ncbi:helix-turn-helix domain-containing protein [Flavobacterium sp. FlaQc-52]|jgi:AraC-like DNA-binding protein|uniref:helix-turn-helix domain-containing protein n=1 Tax=Flavobacterium sp. FlaQc-52 TaxID=3374185 RepID=UPI003757940D
MNINLLTTIFIVGGLTLLSFLKLSNVDASNRKANISFGIFLLLWSSFWLDELLFASHLEKGDFIFYIIRFVQLFTPIPFYFSIVFYTSPNYKITFRDLRFLVVPLLFLILILFRSLLDKTLINLWISCVSPLHALYYLQLSFRRILKHQKDIEIFSSNKELISLNWIKYIIYCLVLSALATILYTILVPNGPLNTYINLFFLGTVYFVAYHSIKQKELFPVGYVPEKETEIFTAQYEGSTPKNKLFDDKELVLYKNKLLQLMSEEKPYLDTELNLIKLSDMLGLSGHQLSYIINNGFDENFFYFVNKFRVQKAKELLEKQDNDKFTILAVGYDAGFNSKTSFNTTFKKMTGETPSDYRKKHSKP